MSPISSQTTYLLKLQDRWKVAERTMAFQFEKPEGFIFKAGQFVDMTLIHPSQTDAEGNRRGPCDNATCKDPIGSQLSPR